MTDQELMKIAEEQIDFIAGKFNDSRPAGRLALLSVLMGVRDQIQKNQPARLSKEDVELVLERYPHGVFRDRLRAALLKGSEPGTHTE